MKTHLLINILNHLPPQSEWNGDDTVTTPEGDTYSLSIAAEHMTPGESTLAPALLPKEKQPEAV